MAYSSYFPATYQPIYPYQQYQQPLNQQLQNMQQLQPLQNPQQLNQQQNAMQIQYGNVVVVPSEQDVDAYPVAPGNCVTFKVENAPLLITKTKPFSALADPIKERYVLTKEQAQAVEQKGAENAVSLDCKNNNIDLSDYITKAEFAPILGRIDALNEELEQLKADICKNSAKTAKIMTKKGDNND